MARLRVPRLLLCLCLLPASAAPAVAQSTAEQAIDTARETYGPPAARRAPEPCPVARPGEIVVCREVVEDDRYRVPSSTDDAIAADQPVDDGLPRAPDVFGIPPCETYQVCTKFGRTPTPALMIDLKAIPEAPPGSDAARYREGWDGTEDAEQAPAEPSVP